MNGNINVHILYSLFFQILVINNQLYKIQLQNLINSKIHQFQFSTI